MTLDEAYADFLENACAECGSPPGERCEHDDDFADRMAAPRRCVCSTWEWCLVHCLVSAGYLAAVANDAFDIGRNHPELDSP